MEQRMLVVVFNGNELPDESVVKIHNIIAKTAFAHPDDVVVHTINEEQLARIVAKEIIKSHSKTNPQEELSGDRAIKLLSKKYNFNDKTSMVVQFATDLADIYERTKHGKNIQSDNDFIDMLRSLIQKKYFHSSIAAQNGYNENVEHIISQIYYKFFDENGNLAKRG